MTLSYSNNPMNSLNDLIVAQASAKGSSSRGIIRLSGSKVLTVLALFFTKSQTFFEGNPFDSNEFSKILNANKSQQEDIHLNDQSSKKTIFLDIKENNSNKDLSTLIGDSRSISFITDPNSPAIVCGWFRPWKNKEKGRIQRLVPCQLYYWPDHRGFTGQRSAELHLPGSPVILDAIIKVLCSTGLARLAQPGEFTLRAFLSGRIDLTQAEAVLGVIDATNDLGLKTALTQLAGGIGKPLTEVQSQLFQLACDIEAGLDFADEEIEFVSRTEISRQLVSSSEMIRRILNQMEAQTRTETSLRIVLLGKPNSGKSSLFNRLSQSFFIPQIPEMNDYPLNDKGINNFSPQTFSEQIPSAIVSEIAGTTRDYLESEIKIQDHSFLLIDTAGLDDQIKVLEKSFETSKTESDIQNIQNVSCQNLEIKSQKATDQAQKNADIILFCVDISRLSDSVVPFSELEIEYLKKHFVIIVLTKSDQIPRQQREKWVNLLNNHLKLFEIRPIQMILASSLTGEGINELGKAICRLFNDRSHYSEVVPSTAIRCRESLRLTTESLKQAIQLVDSSEDDVLIASEIRVALDQLGLILGTVHTDDILNRIFSRFCIGK